MEPADGAARDGHEGKWKQASREDRAGPVNERVMAGMCKVGRSAMMPSASMHDCAEFDEGAQVVARREQKPDRHGGGGKPVNDDQNGKRGRA